MQKFRNKEASRELIRGFTVGAIHKGRQHDVWEGVSKNGDTNEQEEGFPVRNRHLLLLWMHDLLLSIPNLCPHGQGEGTAKKKVDRHRGGKRVRKWQHFAEILYG